jgi:spore germination protein
MEIHVVNQGDTIHSIAKEYSIPASRLIRDNDLAPPYQLVEGQSIIILHPEEVYTVREGDTLLEIAERLNVPVMQLLQNNHALLTRDYIYPGEELVIRYPNKKGTIQTNGFAYPFIKTSTLKKSLPYLTYLTIFGYTLTLEGNIIDVNDKEIRDMAHDFGVATLMFLSTFNLHGIGSIETIFTILENDELTENLIDSIIDTLRKNNFYGVMVTFQYLDEPYLKLYENYVTKLSDRLKKEGYKAFIILTPVYIIDENKVVFKKINYSYIGEKADGIILMNYNWGVNYNPPLPISSLFYANEFLEYIVDQIPPGKISLGLPIMGYDWELPYIIGITKAHALKVDSIMNLAQNTDVTIHFDHFSHTPYFYYQSEGFGTTVQHKIWFIDARSIEALSLLFKSYSLSGTCIWNIMEFHPQLWLIINSYYEIEKLL